MSSDVESVKDESSFRVKSTVNKKRSRIDVPIALQFTLLSFPTPKQNVSRLKGLRRVNTCTEASFYDGITGCAADSSSLHDVTFK